MQFSQEHLESLFESLVGDDQRLGDFTLGMSTAVRRRCEEGGNPDPDVLYRTLEAHAQGAVMESVPVSFDVESASPSTLGPKEHKEAVVLANGIFGVIATVCALKTVGGLYEDYAEVAQHERQVRGSVRTVLGQVYGIALSDKMTGRYNFAAYRVGRDPEKLRHSPRILLSMFKNRHNIYQNLDNGFRIDEGADGQLMVVPAFRRKSGLPDHQCPATALRTTIHEQTRPSLWVFMEAIGDVAVRHIYPRQFEITSEPN
jgi:hypothetical protein